MRAWTGMLVFKASVGLGVAVAAPATPADETCRDQADPAARVFRFEAPPPPGAALAQQLRAGRAYLREGQRRARQCRPERGEQLRSGYLVATLARGRLQFSAPDPLPVALGKCLRREAGKAPRFPAAFGPRSGLELSEVWFLGAPVPPARGSAAPPGGRRSFAEIETEVQRHLPGMAACFGALWEQRPRAHGTVWARLTVAESGAVEQVDALGPPSGDREALLLAQPCLFNVLGRLRLPARRGIGRTVMSYPLVLAPAGSN